MEKALNGVKVLDLTRVLAGPFCTMILGDLGAEVIKVEIPGSGDDSREYGPFINGESAYFMSINRNKKSITIDLKSSEGKEILRDLIMKSDVIVENFRPGTMEKLGFGYETLKEMNPRLIYAASSGFGHTGPYSDRPAYDGVVQAMGGIMSITGEVGGMPTRVGPSIGDVMAGVYTAVGILAALNSRNNNNLGQKVDISMLDCQVSILENALARYFTTGVSPKPLGNKHSSIIPFEPFPTKDGFLMVACGNDSLFKKFCKVLGKESLGVDERFLTNPKRAENYVELKKEIVNLMLERSTDEWNELLVNAGVPCGPINNMERVVNDPQIKARDMILEVMHPVAGLFKSAGSPLKLSLTPVDLSSPAPLLGEHSKEILKDVLGYREDKIQELKEKKIV